MSETGESGLVGSLAVLSGAALCLVVGAVGAVGVAAGLRGHWRAFFLFERTIEAATPVAVALLVVLLLAGIGTAVRT